jgi:hypothetical protein
MPVCRDPLDIDFDRDLILVEGNGNYFLKPVPQGPAA